MQEFRDDRPRQGPASSASRSPLEGDSRARLEEVGDLHFHAAAYGSASEYYRSALRLAQAVGAIADGASTARDSAELRRLLLKLADCCRLQGLFPEAALHLEAAQELVEPDDRVETARIGVRRARILQERGRFAEAIETALDAFSVLSMTDRHRDVAGLQMVLGIAHACTGRVVKAEEFFQDALATYRRIDDEVSQAHVLNNLAILAKRSGQWGRALKLYDRAEALFQAHGATYESSVLLLNKAVVYRKTGEVVEARATALRGLKFARSRGDVIDQARLHLLLGQIGTQEGRYADAEASLIEARVLAERADSARDLALVDEFLGDLMRAQGRWGEAEANYDLAEERARSMSRANDILAELSRRQAELALDLDELERAEERASQALEWIEATGEEYEKGFALRVLAEVAARRGDRDRAVSSYEEAVRVFRSLRLAPEIGRSLVDLSETLLTMGGQENARLARARLGEALEMEDAEGVLDLGAIHLALARAELVLGRLDEALLSLYEIERLELLRDPATAGAVEELRRRIEKRLTKDAHDAAGSYRLLADLNDLVDEDDFPRSEALASILRATAQRLGAERGLVARSDAHGRVEVLATVQLTTSTARALAQTALSALSSEEPGAPRVWTRVATDSAWASVVGTPRGPLGSIVAIRVVDPESGLEGVFYFDTDAEAGAASPFERESLALASTYVELLRTRLLETAVKDRGGEGLFHKGPFARVITQSDKIFEVLDHCAKVAPSPYTVLFQGETGTGKGMLARLIHELSPRSGGPFISVNCAAIPETLLESELFGHVRGAFTGAEGDKEGLVVAAAGGTLFLDEIGKMPLPMQAKLLHFLDSREVRPVGGTRSRAVDVRVLCATKRDLKAMVREESLIEDLYYRLLDFPIVIPPLRERPEDVLLLAETFVERTCAQLGRPVPRLTRALVARLRAYAWPGNVRELEKVVRRSVVMADGDDRLRESHLPPSVREGTATAADGDAVHEGWRPLKAQVADLERQLVQSALAQTGWNRSEAARRLEISYPTLLQKIRIYGLKPPS